MRFCIHVFDESDNNKYGIPSLIRTPMGRTISGRIVRVASPDGDIKYNYRQLVF